MKTAGIIVVGDEILKGQVADQNIAYLAPRLHRLGIKLQKVSIISDSVEEIAKEVAEFSSKYDTVITTGGVGPTHDDVTYEGVAAAFGENVVISQEIVNFWAYFTLDPEGKTAATQKLTSIPKSAVVLYPEVPKTAVSKGKFPVVTMKNVIIFPGVPKFLQIIFNALEGSYFSSHGVVFNNKTVYLKASEQQITDVLNETVKRYSPGVQFGSYPKYDNDYYRVLITIESESMNELNKAHDYFISQLNENCIAKDADLLCNAYKNVCDLVDSKKLGEFGQLLENSFQVVEQCFDQFKNGEIFLSFNGGKDCTALLHLVHSVMVKRFGQQAYPPLTGVYFKPQHAFKEIEEFIYQSASRYNVNLIVKEGPIKQGLEALIKKEGSEWKACLMGVRRNDPNCKNLNYMQATDEGWPRLVRVSPILDWTFQDVWAYLRELQVPYCPLYDRGKLVINDKPLEEFRRRAEEISNLLSTAIGPSGLSILINNSGSITISKTAIEIITVFDQRICLERDFILDCMKNLDRDLGDGSKTFIILLSALLLHSENFSRTYLIKHFTTFLNSLCSIQNAVNFEFDHSKIIDTFYSTRFPIHISSVLSTLLNEWVKKNTTFNENVFQNLFAYFDALVTVEEKSSPLSESRIIKGLRVNGHFHGKFPKRDEYLKLVTIYLSEENEGFEEDINSDVREISIVLKALHCSNIFIVTNCALPPTSLQLLSEYHVLTHVASESVHLLYDYVTVNNNKIDSYQEVKVFNVCNSFRTDIIIDIPFYHLILCAPSKTFSKSYIGSLKNCLKLCSYALVNKSPIVECGEFEKYFIMRLMAICEDSTNIFLKGGQELHCNNYFLNAKLEKLNIRDVKVVKTEEAIIKVTENLISKLPHLDSEVISILIKVLNQYIFKVFTCNAVGFEPLRLKIDVLIRVFSTFLTIINIDKVLKIQNIDV